LNRTQSLAVSLVASVAIPGAVLATLLFLVQLSKVIYGQAFLPFLTAEVLAFFTTIALVTLLRVALKSPEAPKGFFRNALDFLAMSRWHPAVIVAMVGLVVLPLAWYFSNRPNYWYFLMLWQKGPSMLRSGDMQAQMDTVAVVLQLALMGGLPLLFVLHMLSRWKPKNFFLTWALIPLFFVGAVIGIVILGTIAHFASS
jgi:hypothetical protein